MRTGGSPWVRWCRRFVQGRTEELGISVNGGSTASVLGRTSSFPSIAATPARARARRERWRPGGARRRAGLARGGTERRRFAGDPKLGFRFWRRNERERRITGEMDQRGRSSSASWGLVPSPGVRRLRESPRRRSTSRAGTRRSFQLEEDTFMKTPLGFFQIRPGSFAAVDTLMLLLRTPWKLL